MPGPVMVALDGSENDRRALAVAVGLALLPPVAQDQPWLAETTLWLAAVLTVGSGAQYVWEGSRATASGGVRA